MEPDNEPYLSFTPNGDHIEAWEDVQTDDGQPFGKGWQRKRFVANLRGKSNRAAINGSDSFGRAIPKLEGDNGKETR